MRLKATHLGKPYKVNAAFYNTNCLKRLPKNRPYYTELASALPIKQKNFTPNSKNIDWEIIKKNNQYLFSLATVM